MKRSAMVDDRISELADEILMHIISFLPPKFAYTISLVSKRWKPLCQFLTVLRFDDIFVKDEEQFSCFRRAVDSIMLRQHQPIKAFHLRCHSPYLLVNLDEWIEAANKRGAKDLQLSMFTFDTVFLMYRSSSMTMKNKFINVAPTNIFNFQTLVILKLKRVCIAGNIGSVDLPSLKTLHLKGIGLQNSEDLKKIISGSSVLEDFYVMVGYKERASIPLKVDLSSHKLYCSHEPYHVLLKGIYYDVKCLKLNVRIPNERIISYFQGSSLFRSIVHLELLFSTYYGWDDIESVLHNCPNLQILLIGKQIFEARPKNWRSKWEWTLKDCSWYKIWKCPKSVPKCISSHLRSCTLTYEAFRDFRVFATYILQNAQLLEVMTIKIRIGKLYDSDNYTSFLDELYSCARISPICEISIEYI